MFLTGLDGHFWYKYYSLVSKDLNSYYLNMHQSFENNFYKQLHLCQIPDVKSFNKEQPEIIYY